MEPDPGVASKTPEAFFVIDDGQRIVQWSGGAALTLGVGMEAAVGKPCYETVGGRDPFGRAVCGAKCLAFEALQSGRLSSKCALVLKRPDQQSLRFFCKLTALPKPPGGALVTLVESPRRTFATSQASLTTSAVETTRDLATLATLSSSLSHSSLDQGIERSLEWLRQTTGAEAAEMFLAEPGEGDLLLSAYSGLFRNAFAQITRFHPGEGFPGLVATRQAPIVTADLLGDSRYLRTRVKERGFRSYVCVPLLVGNDHVVGSLHVASRDAYFDVDRALRLLTWTGGVVSPFLEAGVLHQRLSVAVPSAVSGGGDQLGLDGVLRAVLRQMITLGNATGGALYLYDQGVQGLVRRVMAGEFPGVACPDVGQGNLQTCPALVGGHGIALYGSRHQWPMACQQLSIRDGMVYCVPLVADGEPIGVAQISYDKRSPWPPTRYLTALMEVGQQAAELIGWAWQRSRAEQRAVSLWAEVEKRMSKGVYAAPTSVLSSLRETSGPDSGEQGPFLDIRCLGPFALYREGRLVTPEMFVRRGAQTLLKVLLVHEGRPVPRDVLMELLWPETDPRTAANRLYVLVHTLRRVIEPSGEGPPWTYVLSDSDRYCFNMNASFSLDLQEFRRLLDLGKQLESDGDTAQAIHSYEAAVNLYRGDLLEEEPYADWSWELRESLREIYLDALKELGALYLSRNSGNSVEVYRRALRTDPLREDIQQGLMRALSMAGRREEALRQYQVFRDILSRELDVTPLPETEELYRAVRDNGSL